MFFFKPDFSDARQFQRRNSAGRKDKLVSIINTKGDKVLGDRRPKLLPTPLLYLIWTTLLDNPDATNGSLSSSGSANGIAQEIKTGASNKTSEIIIKILSLRI
jgi:hypothetical protein